MTLKVCAECKILLAVDEFHKNKRRLDGYHEYCKKCRKNQYERRDKVSAVKRSAVRYALNKEALLAEMRVYYQKTRDKKLAYGRNHYAKNRSAYVNNAASRKQHIAQATPRWFDDLHALVLREAYDLAKLRAGATKINWDVDHVVPLRGRNVCGLHVLQNIAVIPRTLNNFKRAKYCVN